VVASGQESGKPPVCDKAFTRDPVAPRAMTRQHG
jgi:hypothetical protein